MASPLRPPRQKPPVLLYTPPNLGESSRQAREDYMRDMSMVAQGFAAQEAEREARKQERLRREAE